ncbi:MAG: hypothetical protein RL712_268, partial [Bacteroidota bacterium]
QYNKQVYLKPFSASTRNLAANGDTTEKYESLLFDSLSTATPKLKYIYSINPQSNDITPDNYNAETNNNTIIQSHTVMPWYAYDDGSAEGGFGLDYAFLGNLKGQFAMDFNVPSWLGGILQPKFDRCECEKFQTPYLESD